MPLMTKDDLHGFVPAVVTPFSETGEILEGAFCHLVDWLISLGATAICVAGDNGESWALSAAERGRLTALAIKAAKSRAHVMTGCSAPTLQTSLEYARAGQESGAAALLMMPPTYVLKGSRDEITRRYAMVSKEVPLPLVVYNSPRRVGYSLGLEDLDAICDVAPIIGIKESHRDFFHHTHLIEKFRHRLSVMVGPCHYILPGIALGARGFIATGPELLGPLAGQLAAMAHAAPDEAFTNTHYRLTVIYETLMGLGTWPSSFKAALNLIGQPAGVPRDPVSPLDADAVQKLRDILASLGIDIP
jgi:4-hydroxy-tetrahydrodipicolinate synthase